MLKDYQNFVALLIQTEKAMERFYTSVAKLFPADKVFWIKMANEENLHAKLIEEYPFLFASGSENLPISAELVEKLKYIIDHVNEYTDKAEMFKLTPTEAIKQALAYEEMAIEAHFHKIFANVIPAGNVDIFAKLQEEDKRHAQKLKEFANKYDGNNV